MQTPTLALVSDHWAFLLTVWICGLVIGGTIVGAVRDRAVRR